MTTIMIIKQGRYVAAKANNGLERKQGTLMCVKVTHTYLEYRCDQTTIRHSHSQSNVHTVGVCVAVSVRGNSCRATTASYRKLLLNCFLKCIVNDLLGYMTTYKSQL